MAIDGWSFVVEGSFRITGRGVAVTGVLTGAIERSGLPADLTVEGEVTLLDSIAVEFVLHAREGITQESIALFIPDRTELVPTGAVLSGPVPVSRSG